MACLGVGWDDCSRQCHYTTRTAFLVSTTRENSSGRNFVGGCLVAWRIGMIPLDAVDELLEKSPDQSDKQGKGYCKIH